MFHPIDSLQTLLIFILCLFFTSTDFFHDNTKSFIKVFIFLSFPLLIAELNCYERAARLKFNWVFVMKFRLFQLLICFLFNSPFICFVVCTYKLFLSFNTKNTHFYTFNFYRSACELLIICMCVVCLWTKIEVFYFPPGQSHSAQHRTPLKPPDSALYCNFVSLSSFFLDFSRFLTYLYIDTCRIKFMLGA